MPITVLESVDLQEKFQKAEEANDVIQQAYILQEIVQQVRIELTAEKRPKINERVSALTGLTPPQIYDLLAVLEIPEEILTLLNFKEAKISSLGALIIAFAMRRVRNFAGEVLNQTVIISRVIEVLELKENYNYVGGQAKGNSVTDRLDAFFEALYNESPENSELRLHILLSIMLISIRPGQKRFTSAVTDRFRQLQGFDGVMIEKALREKDYPFDRVARFINDCKQQFTSVEDQLTIAHLETAFQRSKRPPKFQPVAGAPDLIRRHADIFGNDKRHHMATKLAEAAAQGEWLTPSEIEAYLKNQGFECNYPIRDMRFLKDELAQIGIEVERVENAAEYFLRFKTSDNKEQISCRSIDEILMVSEYPRIEGLITMVLSQADRFSYVPHLLIAYWLAEATENGQIMSTEDILKKLNGYYQQGISSLPNPLQAVINKNKFKPSKIISKAIELKVVMKFMDCNLQGLRLQHFTGSRAETRTMCHYYRLYPSDHKAVLAQERSSLPEHILKNFKKFDNDSLRVVIGYAMANIQTGKFTHEVITLLIEALINGSLTVPEGLQSDIAVVTKENIRFSDRVYALNLDFIKKAFDMLGLEIVKVQLSHSQQRKTAYEVRCKDSTSLQVNSRLVQDENENYKRDFSKHIRANLDVFSDNDVLRYFIAIKIAESTEPLTAREITKALGLNQTYSFMVSSILRELADSLSYIGIGLDQAKGSEVKYSLKWVNKSETSYGSISYRRISDYQRRGAETDRNVREVIDIQAISADIKLVRGGLTGGVLEDIGGVKFVKPVALRVPEQQRVNIPTEEIWPVAPKPIPVFYSVQENDGVLILTESGEKEQEVLRITQGTLIVTKSDHKSSPLFTIFPIQVLGIDIIDKKPFIIGSVMGVNNRTNIFLPLNSFEALSPESTYIREMDAPAIWHVINRLTGIIDYKGQRTNKLMEIISIFMPKYKEWISTHSDRAISTKEIEEMCKKTFTAVP